jgi:hypothetical protein
MAPPKEQRAVVASQVSKVSTKGGDHHPWLDIPAPTTRALQIYAIDPSAGSYVGNRITVHVPWEPLARGPVGRRIAVVDYDGANKCYYPPVHLDDPLLLAQDGLDPSESDPRFHQQMVYAVASQVIEMFEVALGRPIHWRRADRAHGEEASDNHWRKSDDIHVLHLYPHAMQAANAYYSPQAHGILFGYFAANKTGQGNNLPGQRVFTCLSHDIIAHEVTHAIIDGIRTYFTEPTNPDVLAFHEGFADLAALFSHFALKDSLLDAIQRTGGRLYEEELDAGAPPTRRNGANGKADPSSKSARITGQLRPLNPLIQLALQFGNARGGQQGLRTALGTPPNSDDINKHIDDPHFRGSILVAAVFDAYFTVYMSRAAPLFRIWRAKGSPLPGDDLPGPLADQLAGLASETATQFFRLCARALDYCPPVDVTFGDFLRALVTVVTELDPDDRVGARVALMQAFRLRGIYPDSASFFSEDALVWPKVEPGQLPPIGKVPVVNPETGSKEPMGLIFGGPYGLTHAEQDVNGQVLRAWVTKNRDALGLDPDLPVSVPSFHATHRILLDGRLRVDMVVEVVQTKKAHFDDAVPEAGSFPLRGGVTLIIGAPKLKTERRGTVAADPEVRFVIGKTLHGAAGQKREETQRAFGLSLGLDHGDTSEKNHFQVNFGLLHEEG